MVRRVWTTGSGRVPGNGMRQTVTTTRPDDSTLVGRAELKELVGVSNATVITNALERLAIVPAGEGSRSIQTYNNGGHGYRSFDVPLYPASVADAVREELTSHAESLGDGRFSYAGVTFRWQASG